MIVSKQPDGKYYVMAGDSIQAGPFETNAEAWRAMDRMTGDPVSRSEKVSEWLYDQMGGAA